MKFTKAVRKMARLRLALTGPSGSGKTYSALQIAAGLGGSIAMIDTEHGSGSLYSDLLDFDVLELAAPFAPQRYIEAMQAAQGYDVLIIDSISHEWQGKGGALEINEQIAAAQFKGNTFTAWSKTTPLHNAFIEAILAHPAHVICTLRSKSDFVLVDEKGKQRPMKIGLAPIQRDGLEFEFTTVLNLTDENLATVSKDRSRVFNREVPSVLSKQDGERLAAWLQSGEPVAEPEPALPLTVGPQDEAPPETVQPPPEMEHAFADIMAAMDNPEPNDRADLKTVIQKNLSGELRRRAITRWNQLYGKQSEAAP